MKATSNYPWDLNKPKAKKFSPAKEAEYQKLYDDARNAGLEAVEKLQVVPMVVNQHARVMDDNSPITKQYFVPDGVCGFAWVRIKPANCGFAQWLVAKGLAKKSEYYGGVAMTIFEFNQSYQKKDAYAHAFASVLYAAGLKAYGDSRID